MHFKMRNGVKVPGDLSLWDKRFLFLNMAFFLVFLNIAFFYLYPIVLYDMGGESHVIGWVMGLFSIATVLSRPFMGKMAARKGEYRIISAGIGVILLASLGYYTIQRIGSLMFLIRIVHGIGFSAFIAGSFSLAARSFPPTRRGEAFSIVGASLMGAVALGPLIGESLIRKYGFYALYMAASGAILLALIVIFMTSYSSHHTYIEEKTETKYLPLLRNWSFVFLLGSTLIFAHCQSTVFNFLALIADQKGTMSGHFFFTSLSLAILILLTLGKMIDRYGKLILLRLSYPSLSLGILLIPILLQSRHFFIPALLYGAGIGFLYPVHNALAASHGTEKEKPVVMSIFTTVYDTGFITGAVISGWISRWTGLDILFYFMGLLGFMGFLIGIFAPIKEE